MVSAAEAAPPVEQGAAAGAAGGSGSGRPAALSPSQVARVVVWAAHAPESAAGKRLFEVLQLLQPGMYPSVTSAKNASRRRFIRIDGRTVVNPAQMLRGGELLECLQNQGASENSEAAYAAATAAATAAAEGGQAPGTGPRLQVVWEDGHMACVVKPQGVPCDAPPPRKGPRIQYTEEAAAEGSGSGGDILDSSSSSGADVLSRSSNGPVSGSSGSGSSSMRSVMAALPHSLAPSKELGALRRPRHAHRLDEPTGGLLLVAKTRQAQSRLCGAFENRQVTKRYRALVWGRLEGRGHVSYELDNRLCDTEYAAVEHTQVDPAALGVSPVVTAAARAACQPGPDEAAAGRPAEAGEGVAEKQADQMAGVAHGASTSSGSSPVVWVTTVDLWPHTGRKHQLRRHMALIGHPLLGDPRYTMGYAKQRASSGMALAEGGHVRQPAGIKPAVEGAGDGGGNAALALALGAAEAGSKLDPESEAAQQLMRHLAATSVQQQAFPLCLWALELRLAAHPVTGQPLHFQLPEPELYGSIRRRISFTH